MLKKSEFVARASVSYDDADIFNNLVNDEEKYTNSCNHSLFGFNNLLEKLLGNEDGKATANENVDFDNNL